MSGSAIKKMRIVVILFYVFVIAGLAFYDEKPGPELTKDMSRPLTKIIEPGNAWIAFLGFGAPEGSTPYSYGEEKMQRIQKALQTGKNVKEVLDAVLDDSSEISFQGETPTFDRTESCEMPAYAAAHTDEINSLLQCNEELLRRYESLRTYPRYTEPLDYGMFGPIPSFLPITKAAKVKLLQQAIVVDRGKTDEAMAVVREETEFWKFIARSSRTLISKMVAFAVLKKELRFIDDMVSCRHLNSNELATVRNILRPFDKGEVRLSATLRGESRYIRKGLESALGLNRDNWLPVAMIYKSNSSGNLICEYVQDFIRLAEMTPQEFAAKVKELNKSITSLNNIGIPFVYNPAGEIFFQQIQVFGESVPYYIAVGHNIEGLRRLTLLKVLAIEEDIPMEKMQQSLDSNKDELGNPYTGEPMTWDSTGNIFFADPFEHRFEVKMMQNKAE